MKACSQSLDTPLNSRNSQFWNDLCGSELARRTGADTISPEGLLRYDQAYLDFYPYLLQHVPIGSFKGKRVMEIGLGYGTLGTKIMENGADYFGLDISPGPIEMMRYRIKAYGFSGLVSQGDFLSLDMEENSFDAIVSIGCLHHTGSLAKAIKKAHALLKPGGKAYVMVYNAFSYRHWLSHPLKTLRHGIAEALTSPKASESDYLRQFYDADTEGRACPFTEFSSIKRINDLFADFSSTSCIKENCADGKVAGYKFADRTALLPILGRSLGTDIYISAIK